MHVYNKLSKFIAFIVGKYLTFAISQKLLIKNEPIILVIRIWVRFFIAETVAKFRKIKILRL